MNLDLRSLDKLPTAKKGPEGRAARFAPRVTPREVSKKCIVGCRLWPVLHPTAPPPRQTPFSLFHYSAEKGIHRQASNSSSRKRAAAAPPPPPPPPLQQQRRSASQARPHPDPETRRLGLHSRASVLPRNRHSSRSHHQPPPTANGPWMLYWRLPTRTSGAADGSEGAVQPSLPR